MLDLFRRQRGGDPADPGGPDEPLLRSHIFPKFLKRLSARERPLLLDLGRLSGSNIEILARLGCRVQVEDLVTGAEERAAATLEPAALAPLPPIAESAAAVQQAGSDAPSAGPQPPAAATTPPERAPAAPDRSAAPAGPAASQSSSGRPSRRIVLPPRVLGRTSTAPTGRSSVVTPPYRCPLASSFAFADGAFDAIVAWDLFNFYDPESARRLGGETARILRPGGLVFAYFQSRSHTEPESARRFRIVDETHLASGPGDGLRLKRHILQNRDIEKLFAGLRIVELYFLKNGLREMLLEKKTGGASPPGPPAARPRPRFRID